MKNFLRSNNFARVLALFLAIILWLFVTGDRITRTTPSLKVWQDVPLRVENLNQEYIITEIPAAVDITLEGLPDAFEELPIQEIDAFVDLSGKEPGNHLVMVQGRPPRGLSLVLIEPEQVRVSIEAFFSEDFPVEIEITGEPAEGWVLDNYTILPEVVLVGAPESIFEQIEQIKLVIDLTDMRLFESIELEPTAYDQEGNPVIGIAIDPSLVTIRLEFERIEVPDEETDNVSLLKKNDLIL
jgi:YbbR domain-containing protein